MNVASLDLCKELCNLSSWGDDTDFVYYVNSGQYSGDVFHRTQVFAKPGNIPAYDLGYLLRKLEARYPMVYAFGGRWRCRDAPGDNNWFSKEAATPEDAACRLAIELFKQGILTKGDK